MNEHQCVFGVVIARNRQLKTHAVPRPERIGSLSHISLRGREIHTGKSWISYPRITKDRLSLSIFLAFHSSGKEILHRLTLHHDNLHRSVSICTRTQFFLQNYTPRKKQSVEIRCNSMVVLVQPSLTRSDDYYSCQQKSRSSLTRGSTFTDGNVGGLLQSCKKSLYLSDSNVPGVNFIGDIVTNRLHTSR